VVPFFGGWLFRFSRLKLDGVWDIFFLGKALRGLFSLDPLVLAQSLTSTSATEQRKNSAAVWRLIIKMTVK
jgi:hypothetical protein